MSLELHEREGRLFVKNINFELGKKDIQSLFGKFGTLKDLNVAMKKGTALNKGFAFVEFETKAEAQSAISEMHDSEHKGKTMSVEFSIPKRKFNEEKETKALKKKEKLDAIMKANEDKKAEDEKAEPKKVEKKEEPKKVEKKAKSIDEKRTIFVRNIPFDTSEEDIQKFFSKHGVI